MLNVKIRSGDVEQGEMHAKTLPDGSWFVTRTSGVPSLLMSAIWGKGTV